MRFNPDRPLQGEPLAGGRPQPGDRRQQGAPDNVGETPSARWNDRRSDERESQLQRNASGPAVRTLQTRLEQAGFDVGRPDGVFGDATERAVRAFQRSHGLKGDGVVGASTWNALRGAGTRTRPNRTAPTQHVAPVATPHAGPRAAAFINAARRYVGQRYVWGAGHETRVRVGSVDCSGLIQQAARMAGFNLDGTAAMQQRRGHRVSMNQSQPGDLLFHGSPATHVGIYIGNGQVLHAANSRRGVVVDSMSRYQYFNNARRVM